MPLTKLLKVEGYQEDLKGYVIDQRQSYALPNVIKDEVVEVEWIKHTQPLQVKVCSIKEKSPYRIKPACPIYEKCGGCSLQHIQYEAQLSIKTAFVRDLFCNTLKQNYEIKPTIGMKNPWHYRNKNQVVFRNAKGGRNQIISGFYEEGTHQVINFDTCHIQDKLCDAIVSTIKQLLMKMHLSAYDEDRKTGLIRHVLLKRSAHTKEIMVVIVTATDVFPGRSNFVKALLEKHPEISTVIQNVNPRNTSAVLSDKEIILYGKGFITDILMGKKFKISAKSFYQINAIQTEKLYQTAIEHAKLEKTDILLDTYCGVGTIGMIASDYVQKVIGVEIVKDAISDAILNAKNNQIKNIQFYCEDATKFMLFLAKKQEHIDVVVIDPPRKGCDLEFIQSLIKLNPKKIVYISCNPQTQVVDIQPLLKSGYQITFIQPIDMFPQTAHVECCVLLERK